MSAVKMMKFVLLAFWLIAATPLSAGVALDMVTKDASGLTIEAMKVYAQSGKIRMDGVGQPAEEQMSMIFLGEEFLVLDHENLTYIVVDAAMIEEVGSKMEAAMQKMEAELANMPPEQRAMVEEMMQGQMQGLMGAEPEARIPPRVDRIGAGTWESKPCTQYAVYKGTEKIQEICSASLDEIQGVGEAMKAFANMAGFMNKLSESMPEPMASAMAENPMELIDQIDGFPVRRVDFEHDQIISETTLEGVVEQALDESLFAIPADYTQQDPFAGQ
jgi:hypothetical protein